MPKSLVTRLPYGPISRYLVLACSLSTAPALAAEVKLPYTLDLSQPFHTHSDWQLAITQGPTEEIKDKTGAVINQTAGAIQVCFAKNSARICPPMGSLNQPGHYQNDVERVDIVHVNKRPLLLVVAAGALIPLGHSLGVATWVWAYRDATDTFDLVFSNGTGVTNNQETRFLEDGPLAGDVVVALNPPWGSPPPYPYTITVYRRAGLGTYKSILHYASRTREHDGNALPVIDAEMPIIEQRLHVWRPGQARPTPKNLPNNCASLEMRHGVEWCR